MPSTGRPEFFGRTGDPLGMEKGGVRWRGLERGGIRWGLGVEWDVPGEVGQEKGPPPAEHFGGPLNNTTMKNDLLVCAIL